MLPHSVYLELPPRARRILHQTGRTVVRSGTTSACAENTTQRLCRLSAHRNYLRVRGEYTGWIKAELQLSELPPRARRIRDTAAHQFLGGGTTSACAENTLNELGLL